MLVLVLGLAMVPQKPSGRTLFLLLLLQLPLQFLEALVLADQRIEVAAFGGGEPVFYAAAGCQTFVLVHRAMGVLKGR